MDGHSFFHSFDKYLYNTATLALMPGTHKWIIEGFSFWEWRGLLCCLCPRNRQSERKQNYLPAQVHKVQFSSVAQLCPTLWDPMNRSTPGLPVHHHLLEFTQTHVHRVCDAIQPSHLLSSPSPPAPNPSQHQSLFQWVNSSHEVVKVLEFQL